MLDSSKLETDPEVARRVPQGAVGGVPGTDVEIGGVSPVLEP